MAAPTPRRSVLDRIERIGNALPDPMTMFALGAALVFVVSAFAASGEWQSQLFDKDGELLLDERATNLLSAEGFRWLFQNLISIFVGFRPLGLVLTAIIGISVAERSGLLAAGLKAILVVVPPVLLTPATFFAGVMSSMAVDAGFIVLPPLAAAVYKAAGRSPLVGIATVFAGVASGFNANLFVTGMDPLLSGMTEQAAAILDSDYAVNPACNWYFMVVSTVLITLVGWFTTARFVEPRLSQKSPEDGGPVRVIDRSVSDVESMTLSRDERRGLVWSSAAMLLTLGAIFACVVFEWGFLYDAPGSIGPGEDQAPFPTWISVIVPLLLLLFLIPGLVYGLCTGSIRSDRDVVRMMTASMSVMGSYVVLAFFASIFVAAFERSNLGRMLAIEGGNFLRQFDLPTWTLMLGLIAVTSFVNLFVGSMSAKWAMLSTVFVPMFMTIGVSPELTQVTYRIGDSVTNSITPLNPYMPVLLVFTQQQVKKAGLGTIISMMTPYAIVLMLVWAGLLIAWIVFGLPLGPNGPLEYVAG